MQENDMKKAKTCDTCRFEDCEYNESPCVDCVRGDGDDDMWDAKGDSLEKFDACIMDSGAWKEFEDGKLAVILRGRKEFDDFMERCEKRGIRWASGEKAKHFIPDPMFLNEPDLVAVGRFGNDRGRIVYSSCVDAWLYDTALKYILYGGALTPGLPDPADEPEEVHIKDSGERRQFESGAVRDICEGKGRCDLLPLDIVASWMNNMVLCEIASFVQTHDSIYLRNALREICKNHYSCEADMILEVSTRFEEGLKKYPAHNWESGIPVHSFIDSAVRHYLRALRGDDDEKHMNACVWNLLCCIWTMYHKPEMDDLPKKEELNEPVSR